MTGLWDPDRVEGVLANLLSNAMKYGCGRPVHVAVRATDDAAILEVRDQGIGIAETDHARIFDRFERVETGIAGRIAGTGLGLSIVQEIASLHVSFRAMIKRSLVRRVIPERSGQFSMLACLLRVA